MKMMIYSHYTHLFLVLNTRLSSKNGQHKMLSSILVLMQIFNDSNVKINYTLAVDRMVN